LLSVQRGRNPVEYHFLKKASLRLLTVVVLVASALSGCQAPRPGFPDVPELSRRVALSPGDVVNIQFSYTPQLNETQTIRPDGFISLQLVGEVHIWGKTPAEVRDLLIERYEPHLKDADIAVIVRSLRNRRVFVGGQVMKPGVVQMPGDLTTLEAIMEAGGFDLREADVRNVVVIRHKGDKRHGYLLDLDPVLMGETTQPFYLEMKDIVYVSRTRIAEVIQWVDQHINQLVPQTGFTYSIGVGNQKHPATIGVDTSAR